MLNKPLIRLTELAKEDLTEHLDYLESKRPSSARKFLDEVHHRFSSIAENPLASGVFESSRPTQKDLRCCRVSARFKNFIVIYRPLPQGIQVVRLLHATKNFEAIHWND